MNLSRMHRNSLVHSIKQWGKQQTIERLSMFGLHGPLIKTWIERAADVIERKGDVPPDSMLWTVEVPCQPL